LEAQRFDLLVDAIADHAVYMLDSSGFVATWNAGAERIKGYTPTEIIGRHFSEFFTPEDREKGIPRKALQIALSTGRFEVEGLRVRKDGTSFWANAVLQPVRDEQGNHIGFVKVTRDIDERMQTERTLRESERRFRILVEGVTDYAIYMLDPGGIVVNWNPGAERLKGYTAGEIVGQHFSKFYGKDDRAAGLPGRVLEQAMREGRYEAEGWRYRKDGSRFWASVVVDAIRNPDGTLEGFAKITRDITERRASLEAVRESERQFRLLVSGVTDYAIFMLDPNGIVTSWNAGAQKIKGYTSEEIIGQHFSLFYTERDRAAGVPARALYAAAHDGKFEAEGLRVRKDGSMFFASVVIDPIYDENSQLVGFAKITRDITERRKAEDALLEVQAQRAQAQKMDALGQLTGGVAHDFNNLLMVVDGHIRTIRKTIATAEDPKVIRAVEAIEHAAQRGATLTRQLLTFARRQTINPTVIHVAEQTESFRNMLSSFIGGSVRLLTTADPATWSVKADVGELELALVNLVVNARDAMPDGGIVSITVENTILHADKTDAGIEGEFVALRVVDTGAGIPPDVLAKVFDPFFTTKGAEKGTGLGLSQVHGFAHQSGGTVKIESEVGKGTIVTIYLPRSHEMLDDEIAEASVASLGGRVLLVEDNPDVMNVATAMLQSLDYEVEAVSTPVAALDVLNKRDFDLVLSDIVIPGPMNGIALANEIRIRKPGLPVLLATGYSPEASQADSEFPMLRKPFQLAELSRALSRLIAESKQPDDSNVIRLRPAHRGAAPKKSK
jgi:PAS domain S-box-containing protein